MHPVTLVVITHNSAQWLPALADSWQRTCEGAGAATLPVIIADAGSDDDSVPLARQHFPHARVDPLLNRGFGTTANAAIAHVQTEWLLLANADLTFAPDFAAHLHAAISSARADVTA